MSLAHPLAHPEKSDAVTARHVARNAFLSTIDDADLELKVLEIEPKELGAALEITQRFEAVQLKVSIASGSQHKINRYTNQEANNDRGKNYQFTPRRIINKKFRQNQQNNDSNPAIRGSCAINNK